MKLFCCFILFLLTAAGATGQYNTPQNNVWTFGRYAGLDFSSGSPVAITTAINTNEGCAAVCNTAGSLLFYTDGYKVYNKLHTPMPSGTGIVGYSCNSTTQGALIVPSISNKKQYYLFSLEEYYASPIASRLSYSIVDTSLDGGLGDLVAGSIGIPIKDSLSEKMLAVVSDHCSIWIIVHNINKGIFYTYELTTSGLNTTPVISTSGTFTTPDIYAVGTMMISPDRHHLVCCSQMVWYNGGFEIYDFDPATGIVSNCKVISSTGSYYSAEFSPDSRLLYTMNVDGSGAELYQYDITLPTTAAIIASGNLINSSTAIGSQLKLGPDDKIYTNPPGLYGTTMDVINNPNVYGVGCNYMPGVVALVSPPSAGIFGLPSTVVSVTLDTNYMRHDTIFCLSPGESAAIKPHSAGDIYVWDDGSDGTSRLVSATGTYHVAVISGCSVTMDTISVSVNNILMPDFSYIIRAGCGVSGDTVDFTNLVTTHDSYIWDFGDGTPTDTSRFNVSHVYAMSGTYSVKLTVWDMGCEREIVKIVDTWHTIAADFVIPHDTVCVNDIVVFNDLSTTNTSFTRYVWDFKDLSTDNTIGSVSHSFSQAGIYPVTLTVTNSIGCIDAVSKNVYVLEVWINAFTDTTFCLSRPVTLHNDAVITPDIRLADESFSWLWDPATHLSAANVRDPQFFGLGVINYTVTAILNRFGCSATDSMKVRAVAPQKITDLTADVTIAYGESIQLYADGAVYYRWSPSDGSLDNPNINNPIAKPEKTQVYTVYTYDVNGCPDSTQVTVTVDSTMTEYIPSAFTPNGDGMNDVFRPAGLKFQKLTDFRVFNRWGQQVFCTDVYGKGWDGTFNGTPQDMGVYSYLIIIARPGVYGENIVYKGNVTLIR